MKVIVIYVSHVLLCPPALSVIHVLKEIGHEVVLCSTDNIPSFAASMKTNGITVENIIADYEKPMHPFFKLFRMLRLRKVIWKAIDRLYDENTLIWVISDVSLKHLGRRILTKKYVFHALELSEKLLYYGKLPLLKINPELYGNKAFKVVVAEYNRAHITKTWWNLKKLPDILPNKPYIFERINKFSEITSSEKAQKIISGLQGKKIILYQGMINKERPLDEFIKAVNRLGKDYAFVVMSGGENIYQHLGSENYFFIPFVAPPLHLEITSHAYIGVLCYVPTRNIYYSPLNSLYCAPNKIFEYSMFGIPMLGNDIPGLKYAFETSGCGKCIEDLDEDEIYNTILAIERDYEEMSRNSEKFYNTVDIKEIVKSIVAE